MEFLNKLWVEKYRPKEIKDLVLSEEQRVTFEKCIKRQDLGNFLFHGPPGGGKTVLARILCSKNGVMFNKRDNLLEINGSAKETRGLAYVQDTIEPFLKVPPGGGDKYRIVFIDEADYLTDNSFSSLRNVIEKYSKVYGRFIFTCNYISKIPEPVQSRFQIFPFQQLPIEFVTNYCTKVLEVEKIEFDTKDLKFVVDNIYPDIRLIINTLQQNSVFDSKNPEKSGRLKVNRETVLTSEKKVLAFVVEFISAVEEGEAHKINKSVNSIVKLLHEHDLQYRRLYSDLFFMSKLPAPAKIIVNKYSNTHNSSLIPQMNFMGMVFEIIKVLRDYKESMK